VLPWAITVAHCLIDISKDSGKLHDGCELYTYDLLSKVNPIHFEVVSVHADLGISIPVSQRIQVFP
jgi:hypothetical protein